jgi:hypothetical protein
MIENRAYRTGTYRTPIGVAVLSASAIIASACWGPLAATAYAQSSGEVRSLDSPRPDAQPLPAPVGHRQPQAKTLPESVLRDENGRPTDRRAFDQHLNICRAC